METRRGEKVGLVFYFLQDEMIRITRETTEDFIRENLESRVIATMSNGEKFSGYRSTLYAYLHRGYYKGEDDIIEWADVFTPYK